MELKTFANAADFLQASRAWLLQNEGVNAVAIGVSTLQCQENPPYKEDFYGAVYDAGILVGTAIMTPPHPININADTLAAVPLFVEFAKQIKRPTSVLGPGVFAERFVEAWTVETGCTVAHEEAQAIHELNVVKHPEPVGQVIQADSQHKDLVIKWSEAFCRECHIEESLKDVPEMAERAIANQSRYLLIVDDQIVSMASISRETATGGTINWVYTPEKCRQKGYASVLVAHLSQKILDQGKRSVFLYTQLDNPTSNKIYRELGYRVISDSKHIRFKY